ncbi:Flagellar biosynthesis protein FliR [gamma proteobacterium HdN1]|nr:Flagellar biosynthesis protein FliR [gamma proteobacterium HdN1]
MEITESQIGTWIAEYFWPFCRIGALFLAIPLIGTRSVPQRIRIVLALSVTVVVAPLLGKMPAVELLSVDSWLIVIQQLLIGLLLGFVVQLLFQLFIVGGQMVAMQNGLGFSSLVDPTNGLSVAVISQIYLMTVNLVFFTLNGHLALIRFIVDSFQYLPVSTSGIAPDGYYMVIMHAVWMFQNAVLLSLPAVTALLVTNLSFGVMSRVAPQLNIMSVGFPMNMVAGVIVLWVTLPSLLPLYERTFDETMLFLLEVLKADG